MLESFSWELWRPATCMPDACFCEAVRSGLVRQPANAVSSLAFVVVAMLVVLDRKADHPAPAPGYRSVYIIALSIIGFGSAFYHASLTFAGQFIDVMGMYSIATFILLYAYGRWRNARPHIIAFAYIVANAVLAWVLWSVPGLRRYAFAAIIIAGLVTEYIAQRRSRNRFETRRLWYAVALTGIAFVIWTLDITRIVCSQGSVIQGHAIWHVLGAAASWQLYRYYRSERTATG